LAWAFYEHGKVMTAVRMVSVIHLLWGICLLLLPVPRPFGALEPYFWLLDPYWVGLAFIVAGTLPLAALHMKWFTCLVCALAPQQMILLFGFVVSMRDVLDTHDSRAVLALCYLGPMTFWHFKEGIEVAGAFFQAGKDGNGKLDA
jgi:hypothetical protein